MDKQGEQNAVYTCNGILLSYIKEWNSDTCYMGMNLEYNKLSEISQIQKIQILYDFTYLSQYIETENRRGAQ